MDGKLGNAGFCFNEAEKKAANDKDKNMIGVWKSKLDMQLAKVDKDDVTREVTVKEIPDVELPKPVVVETKNIVPQEAVLPPPPIAEGVITPPSKIRHEWYQTATHVVLTIYVKGAPKDKVSVDIKEKSVWHSLAHSQRPNPPSKNLTPDNLAALNLIPIYLRQ